MNIEEKFKDPSRSIVLKSFEMERLQSWGVTIGKNPITAMELAEECIKAGVEQGKRKKQLEIKSVLGIGLAS